MPRKSTSSRTIRKSPKRQSAKRQSGGKLRLVKISKSPVKGKKYQALFSDGTRTSFGAAGMSDYTKHKDDARKGRYLKRHSRNENWRNPKSAGALSRYVLWNKKSLSASIADYKRRFKL